MTEVINIKDAPKGWKENSQYVYIGRRNKTYGVEQSKWYNPFTIGKDGDRDEVIKKYYVYLINSELLKNIDELKNKTLVCWCKPEKCHGDILKKFAYH